MAALEKVVTACHVKELVEEQRKTHKEVRQILKNFYSEQDGLSERSVRRYCAVNGIRRYDSSLTCISIDNVISTSIAEWAATKSIRLEARRLGYEGMKESAPDDTTEDKNAL